MEYTNIWISMLLAQLYNHSLQAATPSDKIAIKDKHGIGKDWRGLH